MIENLHELIKNQQPNICQIVAYIDNKKVYGDEWNHYTSEDCCHIMSATKSVMSLLIGIAIDQGLIDSVENKVLDYFPEYTVKRAEKTIYGITIKHLLTMRAPYKGKGDPWTKVCSSEDWTKTSLDFLGGRKGLTNIFEYQTVCLHILSGLLYKVSKMTTVEYANKYLFVPLGIKERMNYYAETTEEHKHFTMDRQPKSNIWFCDPTALATPGYGLCLSAEEMAIIGLLCLNRGKHNNQQIVSEHWIDEMTRPVLVEDKKFRKMSYGYLWWIIDQDKSIYAAIGNSGNVIYVDPSNKLVIAITAYFKPTVFDRVDFIEETIKPIILKMK